MTGAAAGPGRLAIVLHTHMPYVEGFGVWPFGEEWLFEAMATSYLPLADLLDEHPGRLTLSVTPVLADQLVAPGVGERCAAFLRDTRRASHALDADAFAASGQDDAAAELRRAAGDYTWAEEALARRGGDVLGALAPHVAWTSSATHAVLPLVATEAGLRLQVETGIASHRARFDGWAGGFWLPECAHAPWLDAVLEEAGVHAVCVDHTDVHGLGHPDALRPRRTEAGPLLVPIDRAQLDLVWHPAGYPAKAAYRAYSPRSPRDHHPWAVDGSVYDHERALAQARLDAEDFVARARERVAGGGLCVVAVDTELLGHWWHEGIPWLRFVLEAADDLVVPLDAALADVDPAPPREPPVTTWGTPRDLSTWSGPQVADLAWRTRAAELDVVAAGAGAPVRAVRELLALQSSDWAFLETRELAGPYALERAAGHEAALRRALGGEPMDDGVRALAPELSVGPLLEP